MFANALKAFTILYTCLPFAAPMCRKVDIISMIGNSNYEVMDVKFGHFAKDYINALLVAATVLRENQAKRDIFIFSVDYSFCQTNWMKALLYVDRVTDVCVFEQWVAVIAQQDISGSTMEKVYVYSMHRDETNENQTLYGKLETTFQTTVNSSNQLISSILYKEQGTGLPTVFVVLDGLFRRYTQETTQNVFRIYNNNDSGAKVSSFYWSEGTIGIVSLSSLITKIRVTNNLSLQTLTCAFSVPQVHGGGGQTKLHFQGNINQQIFLSWTNFHYGDGQSTLITTVKILSPNPPNPAPVPGRIYTYTATQIKQFRIANQFNVLNLQVDSNQEFAKVLALAADSRLYYFELSAKTNSFNSIKLTAAVSYLSQYVPIGTITKAYYANNWDFFVAGAVTEINLSGQTFSFAKKVGFVMNLDKNKINPMLQNGSGLLMDPPSNLVALEVSGNPFISTAPNQIAQQVDLSSIVDGAIDKNGWINQVKACKSYEQSFKSYCQYYQFYKENKEFLNSGPDIPTAENNCRQQEQFTLTDYAFLTEAERNIRATCFPKYSEQISGEIPTWNGEPMVRTDQTSSKFSWTEQLYESFLEESSYSYKASEQSDDLQHIGRAESAEFLPYKVAQLSVKVSSNQNWSKVLLEEEDQENYDVKVTCWSKVCPNFVHYNPQNLTMWTLADETYGKKVEGTYIYDVLLTSVSDSSVKQQFTVILKMKDAEVKSGPNQIKIDMPFDLWVKINKDNLPYYVPPLPESEESAENYEVSEVFEQETLDNLIKDFGSDVISKLAQWTVDDLATAYEEARQRLTRIRDPITVKANLSNVGLLTVSFNRPIIFPSYLTKSINQISQEASQNVTNKGARRLESESNVFVFWSDPGFLVNEDSGLRPPAPVPPNLEATQATEVNLRSEQEAQVERNSNGEEVKEGSKEGDAKRGEGEPSKDGKAPLSKPGEGPGGGPPGRPGDPRFGPGPPGGIDSAGPRPPRPDEFNQAKQTSTETTTEVLEFEITNTESELSSSSEEETPKEKSMTCSKSQFLDEKSSKCKPLTIYFGELDVLFKVELIPSQNEMDSESQRQLGLMFTQQTLSITSDTITVQFNFTDPLDVRPADQIKIKIGFGAFDSALKPNIDMSIPCSRQILQNSATKSVNAISTASTGATTAAVIGSALLQTVMSGCLAQVWGMINGLQIIIHLPAINVEFPSNAFIVMGKMITIACFDFPYVTMESLPQVYPLPTDDDILNTDDTQNIKASLDELSYGSAYISNNLGSLYLIQLSTLTAFLFSTLVLPLLRLKCIQRINKWLQQKLMWNFIFRLLIESLLETAFSVYLNIKFGSTDKHFLGAIFAYSTSIFFGLLIITFPIFIIGFYVRNFDSLGDEEFEHKYGAVYDGLRTDKKSILIYPVYFIIRRVSFMAICFLLYKFVVMQLFLLILSSMIALAIILHVQPFDDPLIARLEVMTECFTLVLIYLMYCFTGQILNPLQQYQVGFVFTAGLCLVIGTHLFFLFKDIVNNVRLNAKVWYLKHKELIGMSPLQACGNCFAHCCKRKGAKVNPVQNQQEQDEEIGSKTAIADVITLNYSQHDMPGKKAMDEEKQQDFDFDQEEEEKKENKGKWHVDRLESPSFGGSIEEADKDEVQIDTVNYSGKKQMKKAVTQKQVVRQIVAGLENSQNDVQVQSEIERIESLSFGEEPNEEQDRGEVQIDIVNYPGRTKPQRSNFKSQVVTILDSGLDESEGSFQDQAERNWLNFERQKPRKYILRHEEMDLDFL